MGRQDRRGQTQHRHKNHSGVCGEGHPTHSGQNAHHNKREHTDNIRRNTRRRIQVRGYNTTSIRTAGFCHSKKSQQNFYLERVHNSRGHVRAAGKHHQSRRSIQKKHSSRRRHRLRKNNPSQRSPRPHRTERKRQGYYTRRHQRAAVQRGGRAVPKNIGQRRHDKTPKIMHETAPGPYSRRRGARQGGARPAKSVEHRTSGRRRHHTRQQRRAGTNEGTHVRPRIWHQRPRRPCCRRHRYGSIYNKGGHAQSG